MKEAELQILLVDDDSEFSDDFNILLPPNIKCETVSSIDRAEAFLQTRDVDVVFLDIDLGAGGNGLKFLEKLKKQNRYLPVIMITADQNVNTVVKAIRLGASDYIGKSPELEGLKFAIERAISENRLKQRYDLLESELDEHIGNFIGENGTIRDIKSRMRKLAEVASNVLITGQSGTGKELVARGIHRLSSRREQPFIAVNCAALARELVESELFGHEKGSFTGATMRRIGKFELTGRGTLFLDEITEIPSDVQAKLLRVLQEREFERVGGNRLIKFEGRILASSNRDVDRAIADGKLRRDLLFRLNVTHIDLPPLSERKDDIPLLVDYFLKSKSLEMKRQPPRISGEALDLLCSYSWPGNVRELGNSIENAIVHSREDILEPSDFRMLIIDNESPDNYEEAKKRFLIQFQKNYISAILRKNGGNLSKTAIEMGVSRQGLSKMMAACGLTTKNK